MQSHKAFGEADYTLPDCDDMNFEAPAAIAPGEFKLLDNPAIWLDVADYQTCAGHRATASDVSG